MKTTEFTHPGTHLAGLKCVNRQKTKIYYGSYANSVKSGILRPQSTEWIITLGSEGSSSKTPAW